MRFKTPRLAVRGLILQNDRLLLVNAYAAGLSDLWCMPGGGVEPGASLPDNLVREVYEETGLTVAVGALALVNEFHDPPTGFHQVEVVFRCTVTAGRLSDDWRDPEDIVSDRRFFARDELAGIRLKPASLADIAWSDTAFAYDPLEVVVR